MEVINEKLGKKFTLDYSADTLPCFLQWNCSASGDYALGLEPTTTYLDDKFAFSKIAEKQSIRFSLQMKIEKI